MQKGQHGTPTDSELNDDVQEYFDDVIGEVSHKWDDLARKLGFKENRIKGIRSSERDNDHRCREVLNRWRNREGRRATLQVLQQALIDIGTAAPPSGSGGPSSVEDVINTIKDLYATEYAKVRPLPWCEDPSLPLGEVYTNLRHQRKDRKGRFEETGSIVSLADIYNRSKTKSTPDVRRIRVEGDPGIGKSCSCQKLAHDWSSGKLDIFMAVFFLEMRHMSGKVKDAIFEQLLPDDTNMTPDQLWSYIQENQDDVLFILDGLDELSQTAREVTDVVVLIQGKILRNCHVLVTSRPYHCVKDLEKCHEFYKIVGYSEDDSVQFIEKYFTETPESARKVVEQLKRNQNLSRLVVNPLNNVLICIVWEDNEGKLPSSLAELYQMMVYSVAKRYCAKKNIPSEGAKIPSNIEEALRCLGKLSWEGLEQDQLQFTINDITEKYGHNADDMLAIGLLTRDNSFSRIKRTCFCSFLHKTFQEYMAAWYISDMVKKESKRDESKECLRSLFGMTEAASSNVDMGLMAINRDRYKEIQNMVLSILGDSSGLLFEMFAEELSKDGCKGEGKDLLSFICIAFLGRACGAGRMGCELAESVVPCLSQHIRNDVPKRGVVHPFTIDGVEWIDGEQNLGDIDD
ncbi:NACHT, LRR and PYD domains-containing protein 3-like [Branchiostoma floridae]|uniref:NACHT, LRR and PYD domains-containing protein 3-like n=1 Tax=Branchiostoma floridae TaxID=7739 RepID=A0A9J7LA99_BRAFL|nr:NACHT, LRR and PYD domains-containing protein 3-like [Branchiostoma floridae]